FDLFDVFLAGVLGTVLTRSFGISQATLPMVLGSSFLGMFFGALLIGAVADRVGRRPAFLLNLGIYSLFTLAGSFSPNAIVLILTRFFAGIGVGAQIPLSDAYLSELLPARVRGKLLSVAYTIGFCGVPAIGLGARLLVPTHLLGIDGWRWLFVVGSLGGIVVWALQRNVVESPRWLESAGKAREAREVAAFLVGAPLESPPLFKLSEKMAQAPRQPYRALFARAIRRRTLMLYVFQVFQTIGYYGFGTMVPLVLAAKGFSVLDSLSYTTISFLGYPAGSALSLFVIEKIDRRLLIMISALAMATFGLALGFASSSFLIAAFGVLYTLASNIFSNAFHTLQGEIFPTAIRGRATGSAYGLSRLSSAAMPFVLLPVLNRYGAGAMFVIVAGAMAIVIADIGLFAPHTTGLKLEHIAEDV
ncbi:MAG TPA: MFS transporter, partial [Verrucomicrobiae bacterium]|nr:MFS transporter [Verrucomicrobiae bacterium]